jgi:FMN phosphatase YigB (HAD superfamily)
MKNSIKNIIFDLGGVLFDINYNLTAEAFEKLGVKDFKSIFAKKGQADVIDRLEEGKIGLEQLTKELSSLCGLTLSEKEVVDAWNVMLFNIPAERFILLEELRKKYRIFLYSHLIGIRKPNKDGFLHILNDQQINAHETLFIDDSPQHVEGAKNAGLHAVWLDLDKQDIHGLIQELEL